MLLLPLLLPLLGAPAPTPPAPSRDVLAEAEELISKKRWEDAVELLGTFHKREPGTGRTHALFAEALYKRKRMDEAAHHLALALEALEQAGDDGSKEYRALRSMLAKADPLTSSRDSYFRKLTKTLVDSAESLFEEGHEERALEVLERLAPFAASSAEKDVARLNEMLAEARAKNEEVDLDDAGGEIDVEEARPLVQSESERYIVHANLEPEVTELVGRTMDDIFLNYIDVYFEGDEGKVSGRKATIRIHPDNPKMMEDWNGPPRPLGGWWSPGEWQVYCYDTRSDYGTLDSMLETLFHEASHQFMTMRSKGGRAPAWLNEGTASFFEGATAMSDGRVLWPDAAAGRLVNLASMLRNKSGPTVRQVVEYMKPESYPGDHYAFGWGLVYYLQQFEDPETLEYVWRPYYQRYLEHITKRGGDSMELFEELILESGNPGGFASFDEFAVAWEAWILDTVYPLYYGRKSRDLRWAEVRRYLAAADQAAGSKAKDGLTEEQLLLRALGHSEKLRSAEDGESDLELLLVQIDLFQRLDRNATAAARIEELLGLAEAGEVKVDEEKLAELDARMADLDRSNYPLRALRAREKGLKQGAQKLLTKYEKRRSPLLLRSWSLARATSAVLGDEPELLAAADRLRAEAREAGLVPSRILGVSGARWATVFAAPPREIRRGDDTITAEMPALQAGELCLDVEVQGEYEVRATLAREGKLYKSSSHGIVITGTEQDDWTMVCFDHEGNLVIKRIEIRGGGTRARNLAMEPVYPSFQPDEVAQLAVRVKPGDGRLRVTVGERPPVWIDLPAPLAETGHVGYYIKDGRLVLTDFVVEIFP
ncbi:MAG: DUF1570 domain-containing protein [Planctomycetota bacterium]